MYVRSALVRPPSVCRFVAISTRFGSDIFSRRQISCAASQNSGSSLMLVRFVPSLTFLFTSLLGVARANWVT